MQKYVMHISGQGKKWEVVREFEHRYKCEEKGCEDYLWLPKLEYKECDPPEQWEDITEQYTTHLLTKLFKLAENERVVYRNCMHNGPHFIIEKKKS